MSTWALNLGLVEIGEYEEVLETCLRGTELARKTQNVFLLWLNLEHLGRAYEVLLDLQEARRVHEEALELRGALGPQYEVFTSIRLCGVAALSEDWEEAYAHAKKGTPGQDLLQCAGYFLPPSRGRRVTARRRREKRPRRGHAVSPSAPRLTSGNG